MGGIDPRVLVSKPVLIGRERVPGVIGAKPIHLQEKAERKKAIPLKGLYVDIGAKDREDAGKVVKVGDPVAFATQAGLFGEGLFKGSFRRSGGMRRLGRADADGDGFSPVFCLYRQEELGYAAPG